MAITTTWGPAVTCRLCHSGQRLWRSSGSPRAAPRTVASGTSLGSARPVPHCHSSVLALSRAAHQHCPSLPAALWRLGLGHLLENLALGIISALISTITSRPLKNGISALEHRFGHATGITVPLSVASAMPPPSPWQLSISPRAASAASAVGSQFAAYCF